MYGIEKCFGGPNWGVILIVDTFEKAKDICTELSCATGGGYRVEPVYVQSDLDYIKNILESRLNCKITLK